MGILPGLFQPWLGKKGWGRVDFVAFWSCWCPRLSFAAKGNGKDFFGVAEHRFPPLLQVHPQDPCSPDRGWRDAGRNWQSIRRPWQCQEACGWKYWFMFSKDVLSDGGNLPVKACFFPRTGVTLCGAFFPDTECCESHISQDSWSFEGKK